MSNEHHAGPRTAVQEANADPERFLERVASAARRAIAGAPEGIVDLEFERSLADRLTGRPGRPRGLRFTGRENVLILRRENGRWAGESARVVGGVTISRRALPLGEWLDAFAGEVAVAAAEAEGDAAAAGRALAALGLQPDIDEFAVDPQFLRRDLQALPARAARLLPPEAHGLVAGICAKLLQTADRVADQPEARTLVRRTAATYLPDTLRAFAALPPDWARTHTLLDGETAQDSLLEQLASLDAAVTRMRDAAVADDANTLLLNGMFLAERFGLER